MDRQEIIARYARGDSLKSIAADANVCYTVIRRVLITEGVPLRDCPQADAIHAMLAKGMGHHDIAAALGITSKTVDSYTPYKKCSYSVGEKSINAQRIKKCREGKAVNNK